MSRLRELEERLRRLERENAELRREVERLQEENGRLREELDRVRRSGKRQAAPFSKGDPKVDPKRPGRKPGREYGPKAWRLPPDHVDEVLEAPLPARCARCGADLELMAVRPQYQTELPPIRPHVTRIDVAVGRCRGCGQPVRGHHRRQSSSALGAAASHLGPRALALAADLNKRLGLPLGKVSALFATAFGIRVSSGGLCLGLSRLARAGERTYHALAEAVRQAPVVSPDESGWKVGGWLQWLWVFVSIRVTVYTIRPGRGFDEAASVLGEEFSGTLLRDGWAPYRQFTQATHQSCLAHLLRRCHENLETARRGTARFPHAVKRLLEAALELRDRRDAGALWGHGLAVARGRLEARTDRLLAWQPTDNENRKFVQHLRTERPALFTFLQKPNVEATNWWAEQAIRPAVVTRKVCGGNRSWRGAHTQEVLMSLLRTCQQQGVDFYRLMTRLLRSPTPVVATELFQPATGPPAPS